MSRFREKCREIEATQYDGTFDLSFLMPDEAVRSVGAGSDAVVIESPRGDTRVGMGEYVVRRAGDGALAVWDGWFFETKYEAVDEGGKP